MNTKSSDYFLYADDDIDDQALLRDIINENLANFDVISCDNGMEVLQFLESLGPDESLPCCIILDINMPVWSGVQTLQVLKAHEKFNKIPVVMFTTSSSQRDIDLTMLIGAAAFITKPFSYTQFESISQTFLTICKESS
ncbi:MAG: response regulator [Pedobacter sp.]|nr:MAG: response regulator [Pedobacter sp.]